MYLLACFWEHWNVFLGIFECVFKHVGIVFERVLDIFGVS